MNAAQTLEAMYNSEINFRIGCYWDNGFDISLGATDHNEPTWERFNTSRNFETAVKMLAEAAIEQYPDSDFAKSRKT